MQIISRLLSKFYLPLLLISAVQSSAARGPVLQVQPDRKDCLYSCGDTALFTVSIDNPGARQNEAVLSYRLTEDGQTLLDKDSLTPDGSPVVIRGSLDRPGFLRLDLTLTTRTDTLRESCACGYDPESIRHTNRMPDDFHRFWRNAKTELMRIPMDAVCEEAPEREDPNSKCYSVSLANIEGSRVYGWLRVPKGKGPCPAVVYVPGAGVGDVGTHQEYAAAGMAVLSLEVHGVPLGRDEQFYEILRDGVLHDYKFFGSDDPYRFYYRRVILGVIRGIDYLCSRTDVDSSRVGIAGSSQGGALSLLVSGLDKRIKALTANVPAMCDHTGSLYGRPSGWPRLLANGEAERVLRTSGYYDAALNAALISVPALLAVGFVDRVCAPTSVYAAFNNLRGPKEIDHFPDMGHSFGPGWQDKAIGWMLNTLDRRAPKR